MEFFRNWRKAQTKSEDTAKSVGLILDGPQPRDAIHVAVVSAMAGEKAYPGDMVGMEGDTIVRDENVIGIVDPFLLKPVQEGQWCWVFLLPGSITSLKHSWTHPGLDEDKPVTTLAQFFGDKANGKTSTIWPSQATGKTKKMKSLEWMAEYANDLSMNMEELLHMADHKQVDPEYYENQGERFDGEYIPDEFWDHYAIIRDKVPSVRENFFSCAC